MSDVDFIYQARRISRSCTTFYCMAAFLFLMAPSKVFAQNDPSNIDVRLFREINNAQTRFKTSFIGVSDNSAYPILVAAPISLTAYGLAADQNEKFESGVLLGTSEVLAYSIGYVLKEVVRRERPYEALTNVQTHHLDSADPYSFPSGHATGVFALATLLTLRYPKPEVYIPAFAWAGLVGYGRMYFGLHYPSDVLAGALIGVGSAYLVYKCQGKILPIVYKLIGRKESENVSAMVVPNNGGALMNITVRF
ncbi:MAG: phosphatase PAP2 family protein [Bacteroidota bacterium]